MKAVVIAKEIFQANETVDCLEHPTQYVEMILINIDIVNPGETLSTIPMQDEKACLRGSEYILHEILD